MTPPATTQSDSKTKRSRPQQVADAIKADIVAEHLGPGDRLPSEPELIERHGMAKGTIREAVRLLEAQGLVKTRTGPGGGAFVNAPSDGRTQALLSNYFYFKNLSVSDIYTLRRQLEPELAASLAGTLSDQQLSALEAHLDATAHPSMDAQSERQQHVASLAFHRTLAGFSDNALLGFVVGFLANVLTELTVNKQLYEPRNDELRRRGHEYQVTLLDALRDGKSSEARDIMAAHMVMAERAMKDQEIIMTRRFMAEEGSLHD
ncbi:FadR/GntR family transcriptional regulator [Qingshengfaniella alkalisoli]|uniref:FadR family transcriptional regulator n=1 Tax=Qingshengfaniella alkalisoli TaxID=2599296 RepID=A0A5B8IX72_9RHOB|nr:FCD domain-containing protein [Qingshengfaniella alkalisoli]QDY70752.1 FadR family transcriptional regulator [Qingshengfaniella alkalisoli]